MVAGRSRVALTLAGLLFASALGLSARPGEGDARVTPSAAHLGMFETSTSCLACHNGLRTPAGEDVSIGTAWQASMMAHAARDPYWHAAVRREVMDYPGDQAEIEDECAACHMPMARRVMRAAGGRGRIFAHLPLAQAAAPLDHLAADGVSCTVCHQAMPGNFGTRASFNGNLLIASPGGTEARRIFGPFEVEPGLARVMHSSTAFLPAQGTHVQQSELCASCHSLYTHARGPGGVVAGELPEQTPYGEWLHSAYRGERSCQGCHMPAVDAATPIASVLGQPREGLSEHTFVGANFLMLRILNRYRQELGVPTPPDALEAAAGRAERNLAEATANIALTARRDGDAVLAEVAIENLAGHKLPTGYPSRRVWLHVTVRDAAGSVLFESGAVDRDGRIRGNDADADPVAIERHYTEITDPQQVQIYESAMLDHAGRFTTGLLSGVRYAKDNRLLPRGFDKRTAHPDVAVYGAALRDDDFAGGGDRVRYRVPIGTGSGAVRVDATLWYQPIAWRWAHNLRAYRAEEPQRFLGYFESMRGGTAAVIARGTAVVP